MQALIRKRDISNIYRPYEQEFDRYRPRVSPSKHRSDQIREDMKVPLLTSERNAKDRDRWKQIVKNVCEKTSWRLCHEMEINE